MTGWYCIRNCCTISKPLRLSSSNEGDTRLSPWASTHKQDACEVEEFIIRYTHISLDKFVVLHETKTQTKTNDIIWFPLSLHIDTDDFICTAVCLWCAVGLRCSNGTSCKWGRGQMNCVTLDQWNNIYEDGVAAVVTICICTFISFELKLIWITLQNSILKFIIEKNYTRTILHKLEHSEMQIDKYEHG